MAVSILTQADGTTPLSVSKLEMDAGITGDGNKEAVQNHKTCTDCFTLTTPRLGPSTDILRTQVTLSGVGTVAAGVMYLALLSG